MTLPKIKQQLEKHFIRKNEGTDTDKQKELDELRGLIVVLLAIFEE